MDSKTEQRRSAMPVSVKGGIELRKALRQFTPDLAKALPKEMALALKPVVRDARGYLPSESQIISNWSVFGKQITAQSSAFSNAKFPKYVASVVKSNVGYKTTPSRPNSRGFRSLAQLFNKTAAGSIYETAGRRTPNSIFVKNIDNKYSSQFKGEGAFEGRALYRAYEEDRGKAQDGVLKAIENAKNKLNQRTKVVG
jgi:hypothetical protein